MSKGGTYPCFEHAPLTHILAEQRSESERRDRSHPITRQYGCSRLVEISEARHLWYMSLKMTLRFGNYFRCCAANAAPECLNAAPEDTNAATEVLNAAPEDTNAAHESLKRSSRKTVNAAPENRNGIRT